MRLIDDWKSEFKRLWSIRIALAFALINGATCGLAAFSDIINPYWFLGLNIFGNVLIVVFRLIKQPDTL